MKPSPDSPLATIEPRLRWLLPADLYAVAWTDPSVQTLTQVFEHLRTLQHILYDYIPRQVMRTTPRLGQVRGEWHESTLMFTDLAGFTPLLESHAVHGREGAEGLLLLLNSYFAEMIQIISKSGGNLLEFTGDAMLIQFPWHKRTNDVAQAIRAGLRMQRAMTRFASIETPGGSVSLGMRVGIHRGRFLTADIGTPRRMEYVLLGTEVQHTKHAEGAGRVGRVCVTETTQQQASDLFRFEAGNSGYALVVDDLDDEQLGEYELSLGRQRVASPILLDRSIDGLVHTIAETLSRTEMLASYLPRPILTLLVESAARRNIRPEFPEITVLFVNLVGVPGAADHTAAGDELAMLNTLSRAFALINARVEALGGVLKNVTCDHIGSSMLIYFGVPNAHMNDSVRAAAVALAVRHTIAQLEPLIAGDTPQPVTCQLGIARGPVFAAEIGEPRGRREFNILGDTVNTAARLMSRAGTNQILVTDRVHAEISQRFVCEALPPVSLKGKAAPLPLFLLHDWIAGEEL
jgi:class 3 adenylate cyclase